MTLPFVRHLFAKNDYLVTFHHSSPLQSDLVFEISQSQLAGVTERRLEGEETWLDGREQSSPVEDVGSPLCIASNELLVQSASHISLIAAQAACSGTPSSTGQNNAASIALDSQSGKSNGTDSRPMQSNTEFMLESLTGSPVDEMPPEPGVRDAPPLPEITLISQFTLIPNFSVLTVMALSITVTSFTVYYSWNASFTSNPSSTFLWNQPDNTIFSINLLSYISTVLVTKLIDATCDQMRWAKSSKTRGMKVLSFLALSPATSVTGLIHLLFSPVPRVAAPIIESIGHRLWSFQRYTFIRVLL